MIQVQKTNTVVTTSVTAKCNCGKQHFIEINHIVLDNDNNVKEISDARIVDAGYNQIGYFNASFNDDGKVCLQITIENTEYTNLLQCISNTIEALRSGEYETVDDIEFPLTPEEYWAQQEALMNEDPVAEPESTSEELPEEEGTTVIINAYDEVTGEATE